jgi:hypothetical protein
MTEDSEIRQVLDLAQEAAAVLELQPRACAFTCVEMAMSMRSFDNVNLKYRIGRLAEEELLRSLSRDQRWAIRDKLREALFQREYARVGGVDHDKEFSFPARLFSIGKQTNVQFFSWMACSLIVYFVIFSWYDGSLEEFLSTRSDFFVFIFTITLFPLYPLVDLICEHGLLKFLKKAGLIIYLVILAWLSVASAAGICMVLTDKYNLVYQDISSSMHPSNLMATTGGAFTLTVLFSYALGHLIRDKFGARFLGDDSLNVIPYRTAARRKVNETLRKHDLMKLDLGVTEYFVCRKLLLDVDAKWGDKDRAISTC